MIGARTDADGLAGPPCRGLRRLSRSCGTPWQALGLAAIAGAGNAGFAPSHSSLLAALTSRDQRTITYALALTDNLGFGIGGLIGGLIATTQSSGELQPVFAVDAGTFVAFMGLLLFVPAPQLSPAVARLRGGQATVLARSHPPLAARAHRLAGRGRLRADLDERSPPYVKEHASSQRGRDRGSSSS